MSRRIPAWLTAGAAGAFGAALVGGVVAIGALPDSKGKINACYVKHGERKGDVRLLVSGTCRSDEKKVSWNQRGPRGESGATKVVKRGGREFCHSGAVCTGATLRAYCLEGERATGGGVAPADGDKLLGDYPIAYGLDIDPSTPTAWEAFVQDGGAHDGVSADIWVVCASP